MKPLPPAPLTDEDWVILVAHRDDARRAYAMGWRLFHNRDADRRDAELMLEYEWKRRHGFGTSPLRREICRWAQL